MIDINAESLMTLSKAAKTLPNGRAGKPVHVATMHRWCSPTGAGGVRLETVKIGGVRFTSREALARFISRCSGDDIPAPKPVTTKAQKKRIAAAERELERAGI